MYSLKYQLVLGTSEYKPLPPAFNSFPFMCKDVQLKCPISVLLLFFVEKTHGNSEIRIIEILGKILHFDGYAKVNNISCVIE